MRKLSLDLETLDVETFAATPETEESRGTVRGREDAPTYCSYCVSHHRTECCTDPFLC